MTTTPTSRQLERPIAQLAALREGAVEFERAYGAEIEKVEPSHRNSARNFLHYLSIRQHDIRSLQEDLGALGLSSLGVLEPHALASLSSVMAILEQLSGKDLGPAPEPPVDFRSGPLLLRDHTRALLGPEPRDRFVRIMVTMPSEAASDAQLVQDLLLAGMDVMRINCAHDGPEAWLAMVENLRRAERVVGRNCRVQADLAGPKLRTGAIRASGRVKRLVPDRDVFGCIVRPARIWLTAASAVETTPGDLRFTLRIEGDLLEKLGVGDRIGLTDTRGQDHELRIVETVGRSFIAESERTAYVRDETQVTGLRRGESLGAGRIVGIPEVVSPIGLLPGDTLILTRCDEPGTDAERDASGRIVEPARIHCTLDAAFEQVAHGHRVWFDDGKIGGLVQENDGQRIRV
ncbi:MAG: pyruvate kinase, partial [Gammaproteobacteria bacterium]|nr:pyruvate kinase [Gammaproteobacteria bacterium]